MPLLATVVLMQIRPADASRLYADQRGICPRRYRDVAHVDLMSTHEMTTAPPVQGTGAARRRSRPLAHRVALVILAGFAALAAALLAVGFVFETVASTRDRYDFPPPGALFDVGGHQLHILCTGQGSPTVILETGLGASSTAC